LILVGKSDFVFRCPTTTQLRVTSQENNNFSGDAFRIMTGAAMLE